MKPRGRRVDDIFWHKDRAGFFPERQTAPRLRDPIPSECRSCSAIWAKVRGSRVCSSAGWPSMRIGLSVIAREVKRIDEAGAPSRAVAPAGNSSTARHFNMRYWETFRRPETGNRLAKQGLALQATSLPATTVPAPSLPLHRLASSHEESWHGSRPPHFAVTIGRSAIPGAFRLSSCRLAEAGRARSVVDRWSLQLRTIHRPGQALECRPSTRDSSRPPLRLYV